MEQLNIQKIDITQCPQEEYVDIYNPDGTLLVHTNNLLLFDWICLQIKKRQETGYTVKFDNKIIEVDKNGALQDYPDGIIGSKMTDVLLELV